jgi:hypothetical protein
MSKIINATEFTKEELQATIAQLSLYVNDKSVLDEQI